MNKGSRTFTFLAETLPKQPQKAKIYCVDPKQLGYYLFS